MLQEHGFWDYTTPCAGGMEGFSAADYALLLDDMSAAAMNSLCVLPKWLTTGYRSKLPFLDQVADNPVIRSDNQLLRDFLAAAKRRGMKIWLGAVITMYPTDRLKSPAHNVTVELFGLDLPCPIGTYNLDTPELRDYAPAIFAELYEQFPMVDGFLLELEFGDPATPERIPLYNAWAKETGQPSFDKIGRLAARCVDIEPWRDYTTARRIELVGHIQRELAGKGFRGEWAMLCETYEGKYLITQEVNLELFQKHHPQVTAVSYEYSYEKDRNRLGMMEMAVTVPKEAGLRTFYLPRGVMTFACPRPWPQSVSLSETWRRDIEDIDAFKPDGVWWFGSGSGAIVRGSHVEVARLQQSGFADGTAARRALLQQIGQRWA